MTRALQTTSFLLLVTAVYVFFVSAGHFGSWPNWSQFYDWQAEGFRSGHLYTTLPNRPGVRYWDYSYYKGHWYIYWGLVPGLLLAGLKTIVRASAVVGDEVVTFVFLVGRAIAGSLLILAMARRLTPRPPAFAVGLALAVFALAHPTPFLLARGAVYEAAIAAGSCFSMFGLLCAWNGLFAEKEARAERWLAVAGLAFGLAAGSRISLFPAAGCLAGVVALGRWRVEGRDGRRLVRLVLFAVTPFCLAAFGHLLLNRLRFGEWTEFGVRHMAGLPVFELSTRYLPANLYVYLVQRLERSCSFPFLLTKWDQLKPLAPSWLPMPSGYRSVEPTVGLLVAVPFLFMMVLGPLAALRSRRNNHALSLAEASGVPTRWRWLRATLWVGAVTSAAPVLLLFTISMRYEADVSSWLLLLAILGGWRLLAVPLSRAGRVTAAALFSTLAIASVVIGLLHGFTGYSQHFNANNPQLMKTLSGALNVCGPAKTPKR